MQRDNTPGELPYTAIEVAEFEYCPRIWWYEQFEPLAKTETEELFAHLLEMEQDHGGQAPSIPEYQLIERILLRRGAFEAEHDPEHAIAPDDRLVAEELTEPATSKSHIRRYTLLAVLLLILAILLILAPIYLKISNLLLPLGIGLLLVAIGLIVLLLNERRHQASRLTFERHMALGLPPGELLYESADGQGEQLSSRQYPLVGKPDYVVQLPDGRPVPIQLKLNLQEVTTPDSNHMIQLAAYCLILEEYFDQQPTHGILRYADREFTVEYTPAIRKKVIRILSEMSRCNDQLLPHLTKQRVNKCRACTFQPICPIGMNK